MQENGIITIGCGEKYMAAATNLAKSAARFNCPTTLLCHKDDNKRIPRGVFDSIEYLDNVKMHNRINTPEFFWEYKKVCYRVAKDKYRRCAFIDADSLIMRDINEMFELIDNKKIHTPMGDEASSEWCSQGAIFEDIQLRGPQYWPLKTLNGGFLMWETSNIAETWFREVNDIFKKMSPIRDELVFSLAFSVLNIKCNMSDTSIGIWDSPHIAYDLEKETTMVVKKGYWNHTFHPYIFHFGGSNLEHRYYAKIVKEINGHLLPNRNK